MGNGKDCKRVYTSDYCSFLARIKEFVSPNF